MVRRDSDVDHASLGLHCLVSGRRSSAKLLTLRCCFVDLSVWSGVSHSSSYALLPSCDSAWDEGKMLFEAHWSKSGGGAMFFRCILAD